MEYIFGKLTLNDLAFTHDPIILGATIFMVLGALAIGGGLTYFKKWNYLWNEWITTVDHKKIGVMYIIAALIMFVRGFADALLMRSHQAMASASETGLGYLPPEHYDQIFTAHGVIMIFFVAMPFMFGLLNIMVPLQIGARDVAFPYLNSLSFWLFAFSAVLINISLVIGEFAATGWLAYPPLSGIEYSPGVGVDYYLWAIQISGLGSLLSGVNFFVTIIKMRCPGMTLMKMPIFTWTALCSMILVVATFPILTATLAMLLFDRLFDMKFFTSSYGGNQMMYINLIWAWGHPEVYILILPAFGVFSEVTSTFSKKRLFGYTTMVWATASITVASTVVWLHHFFTMGSGANVNAFFGITTMIIAIPTGVKIFNWLFTMYKGRVTYDSPMLWTVGFLVLFAVGGMTGVLMSVPAVDFQLHNSLFLVAHFHNTIIGGAVFGYFAGMYYWFPKVFGFKLNEKLSKASFYCWTIGFLVAFIPIYIAGLDGVTRRVSQFTGEEVGLYSSYFIISLVGSLIIATGVLFLILSIVIAVINRNKEEYTQNANDPWDGRTLEWATTSPPPFYNFAVLPKVEEIDDYWEQKYGRKYRKDTNYQDIHMPKNTSVGFIISLFSLGFGFAMVWHIWWLVAVSTIGMIATWIYRAFDHNIDYYVKKEEIEKIESKNS
jgi:cytochrome o ubiquinol oxidase subunit 1